MHRHVSVGRQLPRAPGDCDARRAGPSSRDGALERRRARAFRRLSDWTGPAQVKGTEFYDAKIGGYVDFPVTDVLQMMGRAGRPQFDDVGVVCIFVHAPKKEFYKKFLYEPFPVESKLAGALHDHVS